MRFIILLLLPLLCGFSLPRGTQVESVAESMIKNGVEMDIYHYRHADSPDEFAALITEMLSLESGEVVTSLLQDDVLSIGLITERKYISVTIQPDESDGSMGYLTSTNLRSEKIPEPPLDITAGYKLISFTEGPSTSNSRRTWVYESKHDFFWVTNDLNRFSLRKAFTASNGSVMYKGRGREANVQVFLTSNFDRTGLVIIK